MKIRKEQKKLNKELNKEEIKKKRKKRLIIAVSLLGAFIILMVIAVEFTSQSGFCASCHYMGPYFESWEESSHGQFECSKCHYPPKGGIISKLGKKIEGLVMLGRYWTKLYVKSKPWAEISDDSCLQSGCHEKRLLEGKVMFKTVAFDHTVHFEDLKRGKKLQCTSCHSQIVQGEHITVTESTCFICHFKKSDSHPQIDECSHCHHETELTSEETSRYNHSLVFDNGYACNKCHSNTIMGDGAVPRENCYKCHMEQERLEQYANTDLMHDEHIAKNKIECNQCHLDIQHKIFKDIETIADCITCHTDTHKSQKVLYTGEGGMGIPHAMPNIMLEKGLSCKGCHIFHEETGGNIVKSDTSISGAAACESCHGQGFARILQQWERSTEKKLSGIKGIYAQARLEINKSSGTKQKQALSLLDQAAFNMDIVERGKAVHNVAYSQELLLVSYNKVVEALKIAGSSYKPAGFVTDAEVVPTECVNCHDGIEELNEQIFGLDFPHEKHLVEQNISCSTCHSNVRRHGEFIATKQSCAVCHHRDTSKDCTFCHTLQKSFYKGGTLDQMVVPEDIMSSAGADCVDCHVSAEDKVVRPDKNKCLDCHEAGYEELYSDWQSSTQDLIQAIKEHVTEKQKLSLSTEQKAELSSIRSILQKIELDGSLGIHNYMFIEEALTSLKNRLNSL
ncbi:MAG: cytochrome c3 family protein [Candidatus Aminicenantes bacterium]|nr:cytochrome c3 family protein [Candidatus Aminicenantes bacterium]